MYPNNLSELITPKVVQAMGRNLTELQCILRWSNYIADYRFNELNKQAMNAIIAYVLASEAQECGKNIDLTKIPKIIMHRMFEKRFLCDIREDFIDRILELGGIERKDFDDAIEVCVEQEMGQSFAKFIDISRTCIESRIFQAATKLATKMELFELRGQMQEADYIGTIRELEGILVGFSNLPGFTRISLEYSKEMTLFKQISALRNRIRWIKCLGTVKCSVLGHNFEVAIISYLMALCEYEDESIATACFFIGLFHDVPETFTGDMPQPVKDSIPGLRSATECFELEMVNEYIYNHLPEHMREAMHEVMLEERGKENYKPLIKQADYLSASFECIRNIIAGSKDPYFTEVVQQEIEGGRLKGVFYEALVNIITNNSF